jgi:tetratricopeptide (TPR) repeat protein
MKSEVTIASILLLLPGFLAAQLVNQQPFGPRSAPESQARALETTGRMISLTGQVAVEGSSPPPDRTAVILQCGNEERARVDSDPQGNFMMTLTEAGVPQGDRRHAAAQLDSWADCELHAELPGFRSEGVRLSGNFDQMIKVGTIVLYPLSTDGGFTVSVTSLAAPEGARKAFRKGQEQEKKGKWAAACDYFRRAIQEYPRYALAWLELGRSQLKQNSFSDARQSFHQAIAQDSRFSGGYLELARLALEQKQWKELADATAHLLEFSPDSPSYWFLNAVAHFNLGNAQQAESGTTRGLRLDAKHQVPQLEYLYAMLLARRQA